MRDIIAVSVTVACSRPWDTVNAAEWQHVFHTVHDGKLHYWWQKPANVQIYTHILFLYYPHLHVSVAFCDHLQSVQYDVNSTIKSCVWRIFPSSGIIKCYNISNFFVQPSSLLWTCFTRIAFESFLLWLDQEIRNFVTFYVTRSWTSSRHSIFFIVLWKLYAIA